ncbi:lysophospholipid acyltransferase family protein [Streptomyces sp. NPDC051976]|uniref:lysophospholipid acyltransferase family protein n=1 Tax=Streptomyces sp. NPDC051976 TaxID=3154947 RepID=UPI00343B2279
MADAKVIPFDEDSRTRRGGAGRSRGRAAGARKKDAAAGGGAASAGAAGSAAGQLPLTAVPEASAADVAAAPDAAGGIPGQGAGGGSRAAQAAARGGGARASVPLPAQQPSPAGATGVRPDPGAAAAAAVTSVAEALGGVADRMLGGRWDRKVAHGLSFLRRRVTGDYEVDEFGYDAELTDQVLMSLLRPVFDTYFRVEVKGIENIPSEGGALVVSNHSGTLPIDGLMAQVAVHDHHPAGRHLRLLAADLVFMLPVVNELARKAGHTLACAEDAQTLLERGEVVGVMPEGFKGLGKPFSDRYKLQRFGRGGFVATALKTRVPIVPCSVVGAEEIYPMVGNSRTLARLLGFPYFPLTPTFPWLGPLGLVPLPTKWTIQFGEPIPTDSYPAEAAEDPMLVFNLTDQVRETIQHTLYKLLVQRRSVFF